MVAASRLYPELALVPKGEVLGLSTVPGQSCELDLEHYTQFGRPADLTVGVITTYNSVTQERGPSYLVSLLGAGAGAGVEMVIVSTNAPSPDGSFMPQRLVNVELEPFAAGAGRVPCEIWIGYDGYGPAALDEVHAMEVQYRVSWSGERISAQAIETSHMELAYAGIAEAVGRS